MSVKCVLHLGDGPNGLVGHGPVDHVMADWPYDPIVEQGNLAEGVRNTGEYGFAPGTEELRERAARAIGMQCRRWALIFCAWEETHLWRLALEHVGMIYVQQGAWVKTNPKPQMNGLGPASGAEAIVIFHSSTLSMRWNGGGKAAIWHHPVCRGDDRIHTTQKPTSLMRDLIEDFTDPDESIADIFAGGATTLVVANALGRNSIGWELDPDNHARALERMRSPLFEARVVPEQSDFFGSPVPKSATKRALMDLDKMILDLIYSREGLSLSEIVGALGRDEGEVYRSLQRLLRNGGLRREGRTAATRYFYAKHAAEAVPGEQP